MGVQVPRGAPIMFNFSQEIDGKWFKIVAWGHKSNMIQLNADEDGVLWLPEDPIEAARLLRKAADIIETKLAPIIKEYKRLYLCRENEIQERLITFPPLARLQPLRPF